MAQASENQEPTQEQETFVDPIQQSLNAIAARKIKLIQLKKQNPKEYDRFLQVGFPLEVYTLLEQVAIELANRNSAILQMIAEAEAEHAEEMAAQFAEEHEEAVRVLALFVQGLDTDLPKDVVEALEVISDEGILDEDEESDEGQKAEEEDTDDGDDSDNTGEEAPRQTAKEAAGAGSTKVDTKPTTTGDRSDEPAKA